MSLGAAPVGAGPLGASTVVSLGAVSGSSQTQGAATLYTLSPTDTTGNKALPYSRPDNPLIVRRSKKWPNN